MRNLTISLSISIGVASFPDDASDSEMLVRAADAALYEAKHGGRNLVVLATPTRFSAEDHGVIPLDPVPRPGGDRSGGGAVS